METLQSKGNGMGWEIAVPLITAGLSAGGAVAAASMAPKPQKPKTPGAPPAPKTGGPETGKKGKKYKPAAQLFKEEDLRLGGSGRLGL